MELPRELWFIILNILLKIDPLTLIVSVPYVSKHMRYISTGVRGEFDLDKFDWWTRCLVHDPSKPVLMTKFFKVIENIEKYFPQTKGFKGIGNMEVVKAPFHGFRQFPLLIVKMTSLKILDLSNNHLTEIPESFERLTSLENLDLSFNKLTRLPESIGSLVSLKYLCLLDNQLTELPETIAELPCLNGLWVQHNKLTSLPVSILSWEKPKELSLMWNTKRLSRMYREVRQGKRKSKSP